MEIISLIVGICALLFAIGVYIIHDRKLKQQQKILNEYQLKVLEQNIAEQKKAEVRVAIINKQCDHSGNTSGTLIIKNYGKATAYNVRFEREYKRDVYAFDSCWGGYSQLLPQESQEKYVKYSWDTGGQVEAVVTWDDESGKNIKYKCTLDL